MFGLFRLFKGTSAICVKATDRLKKRIASSKSSEAWDKLQNDIFRPLHLHVDPEKDAQGEGNEGEEPDGLEPGQGGGLEKI